MTSNMITKYVLSAAAFQADLPAGAATAEQKPATQTTPASAEVAKVATTPASATTVAKSVTAPTVPSKNVVPMKPAAKTDAKPAAKSDVKVVTKRTSKIAPIQEKVVGLLKKGQMTIQAMSAKLDCSEREIRQAIDRARTLKGPDGRINRIERNTFGYGKAKRS